MIEKIKKILPIAISALLVTASADAAEKILFLPQDNRPVSYEQTIEVVRSAGYDLIVPNEDILSRGPDTPGDTNALWAFTEKEVKNAKAAVIATDALLYGGLIPSRKHNISIEELQKRVNRLKKLAEDNPKLKIYLFTSLMRTPKNGAAAGVEEPAYYSEIGPTGFEYGADIFNLTKLLDKEDMEGLNESEKIEKNEIRARLNKDVWRDWMGRREKNFGVTESLLELTKKGSVQVLVLGRDDNAPLSQTHWENRRLMKRAKKLNIPTDRFQSMVGIDEFNLILLARVVNDLTGKKPKIYVEYGEGVGGKTVPAFSDETIETTIKDEVLITGGVMTGDIKSADVVLMVNTDIKGRTGAANDWNPKYTDLPNDSFERPGAMEFFSRVKKYVDNGYPVAIADIAFFNGSDNFLMRNIRDDKLFFKLAAYAGWNTPTNSTGFVLSSAMFSKTTPAEAKRRVLLRRYLDDWVYQSNIRGAMEARLNERGQYERYLRLNDTTGEIAKETSQMMRDFAKTNLPEFKTKDKIEVFFPWNRMFECGIRF